MSQSPETFPSPPPLASAPRPTARQWALHGLLFLVTAVTTTIWGIVMAGSDADVASGAPADTGGIAGSILLVPWYYAGAVFETVGGAFPQPTSFRQGLLLSGSL